MKAVGLLSGGLDSTIALKTIKDMGIDVYGINFVSPFCNCTPKNSSCSAGKTSAEAIGIPLKVSALGKGFLSIVKDPPHGYGSGANPCIDCRILKLKKADEYRKAIGAHFLITGEVVGQRPMSQQKHQLMLIEKETGLKGLIVRPLSARILPETIPEKKGWVDRSRFFEFSGRSRKPQIELADTFDFHDYPCPAGGCKLTEKDFAKKVFDLLKNKKEFDLNDANLLKVGRHFWQDNSLLVVIGRNQDENKKLEQLAQSKDCLIIPENVPGPTALVRSDSVFSMPEKALELILDHINKDLPAIVAFNMKFRGKEEIIKYDPQKSYARRPAAVE